MNSTRPKSRQKMLGLAVGEKSILVAEVVSVSSRSSNSSHAPAGDDVGAARRPGRATAFEATHLAEFVYPEGVGLEQGEALGQALAQFLKSNGFSARHAVAGIPAKWVVVKPKQVPPAEPAVVAETLRLQAEGDFPQGLSDLVYDYAGDGSATQAKQVLLMATPRRYVDQVQAVAKAARLDLSAVTPSAASLGWATSRSAREGADGAGAARDAMVLMLGTAGAEFTANCGSSPCALRHLGPTPSVPPGPLFLSELRRTASLLPASAAGSNGSKPAAKGAGGTDGVGAAAGDGGRELVVWNGFSTDLAARQAVGDSLGIPVRAGDLASLGVVAPGTNGAAANGAPANPGHFAPAVALALTGLAGAFGPASRGLAAETEGAPADFLHPRLAPPEPRRVDRRIVWGVVAGVALLALFVVLLLQQNAHKAELDTINGYLTSHEKEIKAAKSDVDMIGLARNWQGGNPKFLPCLADLTRDMPNDGQTYLTSFDLHEDMKGSLQGKSTSNDNVLAVAKSLSGSGHFKDVEQSIVGHDTARNGREVQFSIRFTYVAHP